MIASGEMFSKIVCLLNNTAKLAACGLSQRIFLRLFRGRAPRPHRFQAAEVPSAGT